MPHLIATRNPLHHLKYFMEHPLEYLESVAQDGYFNTDDFTVIAAIANVDEDAIMEHSQFLTDLYFEDELDNLRGTKAILPYTVLVCWKYSGTVETLEYCDCVADILRFCDKTFSDRESSWWTLYDEDGVLRVMAEDEDVMATFIMVDGEGETHNIGPIIQDIYGYDY